MEIIKIALVDINKDYAEAFMSCARNIDMNISVSYIKNEEFEEGVYHIAVVDEKDIDKICIKSECNESGEKINLKNMSIPLCVLTEKEEEDSEKKEYGSYNGSKTIYLFRYQQLSRLLGKIIGYYSECTGKSINSVYGKNSECRIITFTSAAGGVGSTVLSMGIAQDFAFAAGENTLYISVGRYHQELIFAEEDGTTIKEYLYDLFYRKKKIPENIAEYMNKLDNGVYIFNVKQIDNIIWQLEENQIISFFNSLTDSGIFKNIIIDIGNNANKKLEYLYNISDANILIRTDYGIKYYRKYWNEFDMNFEKLSNCWIKVENRSIIKSEKYGTKLDELFSEDKDEHNLEKNRIFSEGRIARKRVILVPEDKKSIFYENGFLKIKLDDDFGKAVRNICISILNSKEINENLTWN